MKNRPKMTSEETPREISYHLDALKSCLIKSLFTIIIGACIAFCCKEALIKTLTEPLQKNASGKVDLFLVENSSLINRDDLVVPLHQSGKSLIIKPSSLQIIHPLEGFTTTINLSLLGGSVLSSPFWLYFILQFVYPALSRTVKQASLHFLSLSLFFIFLGGLFAYYVTIPFANAFFSQFNKGLGENSWSFQAYIYYSLLIIFSSAFLFEITALLLFLTHLRIISYAQLVKARKPMILAAFILGAVFTPPDIFTQFIAALSLIGMYEITILYALKREVNSREVVLH